VLLVRRTGCGTRAFRGFLCGDAPLADGAIHVISSPMQSERSVRQRTAVSAKAARIAATVRAEMEAMLAHRPNQVDAAVEQSSLTALQDELYVIAKYTRYTDWISFAATCKATKVLDIGMAEVPQRLLEGLQIDNVLCQRYPDVLGPRNLAELPGFAFSCCTALKSIALHTPLAKIGICAFENCSTLTSITLPDTLTIVERSAFHGCSALTSVNLPDSITMLGDGAFTDCDALVTIALPACVTTIGESTFRGCRALVSVTLPVGLTTIGARAFMGCDALDAGTRAAVAAINPEAFQNPWVQNPWAAFEEE